jgi:hypothetical protein
LLDPLPIPQPSLLLWLERFADERPREAVATLCLPSIPFAFDSAETATGARLELDGCCSRRWGRKLRLMRGRREGGRAVRVGWRVVEMDGDVSHANQLATAPSDGNRDERTKIVPRRNRSLPRKTRKIDCRFSRFDSAFARPVRASYGGEPPRLPSSIFMLVPSPPRFPVCRLSCCRSSLHACSPFCQDSAYYPSTSQYSYHSLPPLLVLHRHASQPSQDRRRQGSPPSLASPVPGLEQGKVSRRYLPSLLHLRSTPSLDHRFQQR